MRNYANGGRRTPAGDGVRLGRAAAGIGPWPSRFTRTPRGRRCGV